MCKSYSLYLVPLFCFYNLQAVLVESEKLISDDFNGNSKQFYLYYNIHSTPHRPVDTEQLSILQTILKKREQKETDQLHVLLEQPPSIVQIFDQTPSVTTHLKDHVKHLKYTTVENAEIRCVAHAAAFLFRSNLDPDDVFPKIVFDTAQKQCCVGDVTIADLLYEYDYYHQQIQQLRPSVSSNIGRVVDEEETFLEQEYQQLAYKIKELKLSPGDNILSFAQKIYKTENREEHSQILTIISRPFDHLFELYLFKRMIELKTPKIALIAGLWHTQLLKQMLAQAGAQHSVFHRDGYVFGGEAIPLKPEHLNIFT